MLRKNLKKRKGTCYVVTQAYQGHAASLFWDKYVSRHREADALCFMMFMIDNNCKLLEDVTCMRNIY